jgi:hypothetical protein
MPLAAYSDSIIRQSVRLLGADRPLGLSACTSWPTAAEIFTTAA